HLLLSPTAIFAVKLAVTEVSVVLVAKKRGILPVPFEGNPIETLLVTLHVIETSWVLLLIGIPLLTNVPLQNAVSKIWFITGVGLTVSFNVSIVTQPLPVDKVKI